MTQQQSEDPQPEKTEQTQEPEAPEQPAPTAEPAESDVDEAVEESFPGSDPPSSWAGSDDPS